MLLLNCPKCGNYIQSNIIYVAGIPKLIYICNCGYTNRYEEIYYTTDIDTNNIKDNRNSTTNHTWINIQSVKYKYKSVVLWGVICSRK